MSTVRAIAVGVMLFTVVACHRDVPESVDTVERVPVAVASARIGTVQARLHVTGTVAAAPGAAFNVTAPESARIAEMPYAEGDRVRSGSLLVRFEIPARSADAATRQAEVARADARLTLARAAQARARNLFDRGVAARREVEQATQEVADAEAALIEARAGHAAAAALAKRTVVRAPFDGVIARRTHNPGDLLDPSAEPILTLIDARRLEVAASIPIAMVPRIREGAAGAARAGSGDPQPLRVTARPAAIDPATGAGTARLAFATPAALAVGTPVDVAIDAEEHDGVLLVPREAVVREGDTASVMVAGADGKAHRRTIGVGLASDTEVEVTSGLRAGDRVIVRGQNALPDGAAIGIEP